MPDFAQSPFIILLRNALIEMYYLCMPLNIIREIVIITVV